MIERICSHWKTSTAGAVLAVFFGFVLFAPQYFPPLLLDIAKFVALGGAAALGIMANDPRSTRPTLTASELDAALKRMEPK